MNILKNGKLADGVLNGIDIDKLSTEQATGLGHAIVKSNNGKRLSITDINAVMVAVDKSKSSTVPSDDLTTRLARLNASLKAPT